MCSKEVEKLLRKEQIEELYDIGQELGRGKFAIVKRCTEKSTGDHYAAKYLRKRRGGKSCREDILIEIDIMIQAMNHHRIVRIHEVFESQREMIIIIELATGGELFRMIAVDPLTEHQAKNIVWELLEGVSHLHTLNVVHLDLKPENILLYRKGQLDIKIADFGLAMQITPGSQVRTLVGTAEYVAPEILNYEPISIMADMWSIGALTYALLTGYSPFQGETHNDTFYNVSICEYDFDDEVFEEVSQDARDFIEDLLQKKPSARLTAKQCLAHPWMQSMTATPIQNPQTQVHEGLNSSTSSLDSAMCLDSTSSLDPSPISSASSSFAPRPNGKGSEDDQVSKDTCMTQVFSKLCTEQQKADESNLLLTNPNLDGSASSISSNESCHTLKQEEEDGGVFIPSSTTPPPPMTSAMNQSESYSNTAESISRPTSGLRVTTPILSDAVSYAPETIEKLKKLEKLKQRKKEKDSSGSVSSVPKDSEKSSFDRRFSSPVTSTLSKLRFGSLKLKSCNEQLVKEGKENEKRSKSPVPYSKSPVPVPSEESRISSPTPFEPRSSFNKQPSPISTRSSQSPVTKQSPILVHSTKSPDTRQSPNSEMKSDKSNSIDEKPTTKPSNEKCFDETPPTRSPVIPPKGSIVRIDRVSPSTNNETSSPSQLSKSSNLKSSKVVGSGSHTVSFATPSSPINHRSKPFSPQASNSRPHESNASVRSIKSLSPSSSTSSSTSSSAAGTPMVIYRNKAGKQQTRESWRKTPHIDADAIEALLNLDENIDPDALINGNGSSGPLQICTEESDTQVNTPATNKSPEVDFRRKVLNDDHLPSILKKSPGSDSDVMKFKRRTVGVASRRAKHQSLYFGSPERSPDKSSPKASPVTSLQRSLTMSHSSPDLSAILAGHKSRSKKPKREDTYVTGSKELNRRSFFGSPLNRSVTMSAGKGGSSKGGLALLKEKYMSKK